MGWNAIRDNQFAPGSMLPKVEAAMKFVRRYPDRKAITSLDTAIEALEGRMAQRLRLLRGYGYLWDNEYPEGTG